MLRNQTLSELVKRYSSLPPADKTAIARLLTAREQFILKELSRRHHKRMRSAKHSPHYTLPDIFVSCSPWLSRHLFELLDRDISEGPADGPTPAVRALVRDTYEAVGGNPDLLSQEAPSEHPTSAISRSKIASWLAKLK